MAGASAGVQLFHTAETKVHLMCQLRNLYHPLLHASQVRAEFTLASFPPHGDMNCVSSHALCGSVSLHGSEKISHWRCVTYISSAASFEASALIRSSVNLPLFPICVYHSLFNIAVSLLSPLSFDSSISTMH